MKIEYLENGSDDCPLIRIYGVEPEVCYRLKEAFEQLANGEAREISLTDLPGTEPVGGCRLIAQAGKRDKGVVREGENVFFWVLTPAAWDNVAGLMEPFRGGPSNTFQWLDDVPASEARVLISSSPSGCW